LFFDEDDGLETFGKWKTIFRPNKRPNFQFGKTRKKTGLKGRSNTLYIYRSHEWIGTFHC
jgi:hypothetical protein